MSGGPPRGSTLHEVPPVRLMAWQASNEVGGTGMGLTDSSSTRAVRKRCEKRLAQLDLPPTSDIDVLVAHVAERLGHPIELVSVPLDTREVSGQCELRNGTFRITYQAVTNYWHRVHIIGHELGHLIVGHECVDIGDEAHEPVPTTRVLGQSTIARMLGRSLYDDLPEREAEIVGTLLKGHLANHASADGEATWMAPALEHTWGGRV